MSEISAQGRSAQGQVAADRPGLRDLLLDRLAQAAMSDEAQLIVLAALEGEAVLADYLDDPEAIRDTIRPEAATPSTPPRAYLVEIKAQSFRGIGRAASIALDPAPGLVLVVGRNGSGKSSFAEAAEIALTGVNARWVDKSQAMRDGWRNLHNDAAPEVEVLLRVDGDRGASPLTGGRRGSRECGTDTRSAYPRRGAAAGERGPPRMLPEPSKPERRPMSRGFRTLSVRTAGSRRGAAAAAAPLAQWARNVLVFAMPQRSKGLPVR